MTWEKSARKGFSRFLVCVVRDGLSMFSRNPPPPVRRRGCTVSPKKGGALRNQSTGGRRLGVAAALCGALVGAPLLLLHSSASAHASRSEAATGSAHENTSAAAHASARPDGVSLSSPPRRVPRPDHDVDDRTAGHDDDDRTGADHHDDGTTGDDHDDRADLRLRHPPRRRRHQRRRRRTARVERPRGTPPLPTATAPARRSPSAPC